MVKLHNVFERNWNFIHNMQNIVADMQFFAAGFEFVDFGLAGWHNKATTSKQTFAEKFAAREQIRIGLRYD